MKVHKGELIEGAVRKSGIKLTVLARRLKKSRGYLYTLFQTRDVPYEVAMNIGRLISYDFTEDYRDIIKPSVSTKPLKDGRTSEYWQSKYIDLLEKYNALVESQAIGIKKRKK